MTRLVRGVFLGCIALIGAWVGTRLILGAALDSTGDPTLTGRTIPYKSVHLLEEAAEGVYAPLRDPLFFVGVLVGTAIPFAAGAYVAARTHALAPWIVSSAGVVARAVLDWQVFRADFPSPVRQALLLELATAAVASVAAAFVVRRRAVDVPSTAAEPPSR